MNSITQIQQELRSLSKQLVEISRELETLKSKSSGTTGAAAAIYAKLTAAAKKYPIRNEELSKSNDSVKQAYFRVLAISALIEQAEPEAGLLFIQRIAEGSGFPTDVENLVKIGHPTENLALAELLRELSSFKYLLLLDCLLVVNMTGSAPAAVFQFIAELALLLDIPQPELIFLAQLAKAFLQQDQKLFYSLSVPRPAQWRKKFDQYIPATWLKERDVSCGTYTRDMRRPVHYSIFESSKPPSFKILMKRAPDSYARKGEVIVEVEQNDKKHSIIAARDGRVSYQSRMETYSNGNVEITQVFTTFPLL